MESEVACAPNRDLTSPSGDVGNPLIKQYIEQLDALYGGELEGSFYKRALCDLETAVLVHTMRQYRFNQSQVAKRLGINRGSLRYKLRKYGIFKLLGHVAPAKRDAVQ